MTTTKNATLQAWIMATRPKTLTGAAAPVVIALANAWADGAFQPTPALLCLLFALIMQIDANLVNDYFDYKDGIDNTNTLGPQRACIEGTITLKALRTAIILVSTAACATGLPLIYYGGVKMIWIGLSCLLFCFLYTTYMSRHCLGDALVIIFFGLVPVCATYYLQTHTITVATAALSLACGLTTDCLLIVNNYRDRQTDAAVGKHTLVTLIGPRRTEKLYLWLGVTSVLLCQTLWNEGKTLAALLSVIFLIPHITTQKNLVHTKKGKQLNKVLAQAARNIMIFAALLTAGLLINP